MNHFYFYVVGLGVLLFWVWLFAYSCYFKAVWVSQWVYSMTGQGSRNEDLKTILLHGTDLIILPFSPPHFWCRSKQFQPPMKKAHHRAREWSTETRWGIGNLIWILMIMIMVVMIVKLRTICSSHLHSHPPVPYILAEVSKEQFKVEDWENSITACKTKNERHQPVAVFYTPS